MPEKIDILKELTPRSRTYGLRNQGEKGKRKRPKNTRLTNTSHCPTKTIHYLQNKHNGV